MKSNALQQFVMRRPRLFNLWPPFIGAGIRIKRVAPDYRAFDIVLKRGRLNSGMAGSQFGGSLFAMTDPWYMFMLITALGPDYVVWDKAGSIRFRRPGFTDVSAHFELTAQRLEEIRAFVDSDGTYDAVFPVEIVDPNGNIVATVERVVYIATKAHHTSKLEARKPRTT